MAKLFQNLFGGDENARIVTLSYTFPAAANAVDQWAWQHPGDGKIYELVDFKEVHTVASTSGTVMPEKASGTTAVGSGTDLLTGTVSLGGTANTVVSGTLVSSASDRRFKTGDRLGLDFAGTMTNLVGANIIVVFRISTY